tara:strand:- start:889 stop:1383 length:495 start_codon:yes stop_codon:yes gene_type:complete
MAGKPIWEEIERLTPKRRKDSIKEHQENLNRFTVASNDCIDTLSNLRKQILKSEKKILKALENERNAEAIAEILNLRVLRIEEMVELSALSLARSNRFYNKLYLDVCRGVDANVKYDSESIDKMVPKELKKMVGDSIQSTDFYEILSKYKDKLAEFVQLDGVNK